MVSTTSNNRLRNFNVVAPIIGAMLLSLALIGSADHPFEFDLDELAGWVFLLTICSSHFLVLTMVSFVLRKGTHATFAWAMCVTNVAVFVATGLEYWDVIDTIHRSTSSTSAIVVFTLPFVGFICAIAVFITTYVLLRLWRLLGRFRGR